MGVEVECFRDTIKSGFGGFQFSLGCIGIRLQNPIEAEESGFVEVPAPQNLRCLLKNMQARLLPGRIP